MLFTETAVFTKRAKELLDDETYRLLQVRLLISPDAGCHRRDRRPAQNPRPANGHGKRGGARVIYYHFTARSHITLLCIFAKNEQTELSAEQRKGFEVRHRKLEIPMSRLFDELMESVVEMDESSRANANPRASSKSTPFKSGKSVRPPVCHRYVSPR
jgi:hypothetical protein